MMQRWIVYLLLTFCVSGSVFGGDLDDNLESLLEGEFAAQRGDATAAAEAYWRAAEVSDEKAVAERAVQMALLAKSLPLSRKALERWAALGAEQDRLSAGWLRWGLLHTDDDGAAARAPMKALLAQENGWKQVAGALVNAPDKALSVRLLSESVKNNEMPRVMEAWLAMGGVALRLNDKALYTELADAVARQFPNDPRALVWQAEEALAQGKKKKARQVLERVLALPALSTAERLSVAAQLGAMGDYATAARALESADQEYRVLVSRASYLARAEDQQGLETLYQQIKDRQGITETEHSEPMLLGQIAEMLDKTEDALHWYDTVLPGQWHDPARLRIAVLLDKTGKHAEAIDLLHEIQASDSEWDEPIRDAYLIEAGLLNQKGDTDAELNALSRGLNVFDEDDRLRYTRALAYERADRVEDSIADFRLLLETSPDSAEYLNALGYTLVDRTDKLAEGLALIERAIEKEPDSPAILDSLGWALHRLGRNAEALPSLQRAFELQRDAEVGAHLATVLAALGSTDEARSILRLAQEIDPDNRAVRALLKQLPLDAETP